MGRRIAIIGLGDIARKAYLPVLANWEGVDLILHSRTLEKVQAVQNQYRIARGTTDFRELLAWKPEAAFVLTASAAHFDVTRALLEADVDVFTEKPLTLDTSESRVLADLADVRGRILMVGFNRRYAPLHQSVKRLWGERPIGLCLFEKHRASAAHANLYNNYIDDTIHLIDLLRFFAGEGTALHSDTQMKDGRLVGAVSAVALAGGGLGYVLTSLQAGGWQERYTLHGGGATLIVDAFTRARWITAEGEQIIEAGNPGQWTRALEQRGFAGAIAHFFHCLQTREPPLSSGREAWRTQQLLEAMVARAKEAA